MNATEKGSRRRAASRPTLRPDASMIAPAVVVVLALAALLLIGPADEDTTTGTTGTSATTTGAVVDQTTFACPDEPTRRRTETTVGLGLAPAPSDVSPPAGGEVTQGPTTSDGKPVDVPRGSLVDVPADGGPAVQATGGAAAGLFAFRTDVDNGRTLAVSGCATPRSQWWFTGAGAGLDHSSTLLLANVDPGPAVLDLTVLGPDGPVDTVATKGISMAPHSVKRLPLSEIAPQTDELALSVHTSRGRVVASVDDAFSSKPSLQPGHEWLAGTDLPSRSLRLDGLPEVAGSSTLLVANPSELEAIVEVRVAGKSGTFSPNGLDAISVSPGTVEEVDLGAVLPKKEAVGLRLRSRVPVVAAVRSTVRGDHSYATPVAPLVGPASAPLLKGVDASVQLTAGAVGSKVEVEAYDAKGQRVDSTTLTIPATATSTWSPKKGADYLVVTPSTAEGATVHGAVTYRGDGAAAVPLVALPFRVERPEVQPALH